MQTGKEIAPGTRVEMNESTDDVVRQILDENERLKDEVNRLLGVISDIRKSVTKSLYEALNERP